jgi:hypothetical protein
MACRAVKYSPRQTVRDSPWIAWVWRFSVTAWWAHVTVTPEANRIAVFRRGIWKGLKGTIELGGHVPPNSIVGARLLWKKAQKKEKKNSTSETINRIIPIRRPTETLKVWRPCIVPSREMSRHHCILVSETARRPVNNSVGEK